MQTQHITQTQLPSGLLRLTPDKGYTLFDGKSHRTFPTADIYPDDLPNWSAVAEADDPSASSGQENEKEN